MFLKMIIILGISTIKIILYSHTLIAACLTSGTLFPRRSGGPHQERGCVLLNSKSLDSIKNNINIAQFTLNLTRAAEVLLGKCSATCFHLIARLSVTPSLMMCSSSSRLCWVENWVDSITCCILYPRPPVGPGLRWVHLRLEQPHLEHPFPALLDLAPAPLTFGELGHDVVPGDQLVIDTLHADVTTNN